MKARIVHPNGAAAVEINGKVHSFCATRSFRPEGRIIRSFSEHGVRFFNIFPSGIMTALLERTVPYSTFGPVWVGDHTYNWDNLKAQCDMFFPNIKPEDYVSISVHLDPPPWFVEAHPDLRDHWEEMVQNLGSIEWREAAADYMRALIDKMDEWYPEQVYAIFLLSGGTTEWYSYYPDRVIDHPSECQREAFRRCTGNPDAVLPAYDELYASGDGLLRHPISNASAVAYDRFVGQLTSEAICYFAHAAKEHTHGDRLVGVFNAHSFGMQLDLAVRMGYNELNRLLDCPDIDMIFAPASYIARKLESTSAIRTPVDSIRAAGKLFVHEVDSATHLTLQKNQDPAAKQHASGRDESFACSEDSKMYLRRETGIVLAKGMGYWWFDMFSGYYDDPELMKEIEDLHTLQELLLTRDNRPLSEVTEMIDKNSNFYLRTNCRYPMVEHQSPILNALGAPWDMRLSSDLLRSDIPRYKLYLFPALFSPSAEIRTKIKELRRDGACMLFMHAPGYIAEDGFCEQTMEELTGIRLRRMELRDNTIVGEGALGHVRYDFTNTPAPGDVTVRLREKNFVPSQLSPVFCAENLDIVLGRFAENGLPACGIKFRSDGGFDAFSANAPVPAEILREIYRLAGVFSYASEGAVIYTNRGFECAYSYQGGDITLYRPVPSILTDYFTGETFRVGPDGTVVSFASHQTRMLLVDEEIL